MKEGRRTQAGKSGRFIGTAPELAGRQADRAARPRSGVFTELPVGVNALMRILPGFTGIQLIGVSFYSCRGSPLMTGRLLYYLPDERCKVDDHLTETSTSWN